MRIVDEDDEYNFISEHPLTIDFTTVPSLGEGGNKADGEQENPEGDSKSFVKEYDDMIYDSEDIEVTLKKIERKTIQSYREEESYEITLEFLNKLDQDISFCTEETMNDGESIDKFVVLGDAVLANKSVETVMTIQDYSDDPLPDVKDYIETEIKIVEQESVQDIGNHTIKIDFR